jgi:hypothetical protein
MHSLRHSLATYLVSQGCDPKTVQGMLRHSNVHTTLQLYSHGRSQDRLDAQGTMLDAFFTPQDATVQLRLTRTAGESRVEIFCGARRSCGRECCPRR